MRRIVFLLLLPFAAVTSLAQTYTVRDTSPADCPISITGKISFDGTPHPPVTLIAHNHSTKEILALVAMFDVTSPDGSPMAVALEHEYFFRETTETAGGSTFAIVNDHIDFPVYTSEYILTPDGRRFPVKYPPPHAPEVKVGFVQFEDGSIWGDKRLGQTMIAERPIMMAYLQNLLKRYSSGGEAAVKATLAEEISSNSPSLHALAHVLRQAEAKDGMNALIELIRQKIIAAEARQARLNH